MQTERIYQSDVYCIKTSSSVTEVLTKDGFDVISTARSVFFPEGGGQPSDTGKVTKGSDTSAVTYVYDEENGGAVYHVTNAPEGTFAVGDEVELEIDWDNRFVNMQRHCGEHMVSAAFYSLFNGANKGFHMGENYIAIDIDLGGRKLTEEEIQQAEDLVNKAIRDNLPVTTQFFDSYEESTVLDVRKDSYHEGRISVVTIGDSENPFDRIGCCGTHPATTSEVGLVAVYRAEMTKGMNRIYFDCGKMALDKLKNDYDTVYKIACGLSTSIENLPHKLEVQEAKDSELRARIAGLAAYYKEKEAERIAAEIEGLRDSQSVFCFDDDLLDVNDLLKLGFAVAEDLRENEVLALRDTASSTVLLFSDGSVKCGDLVKQNAADFNGKGGGRPDNARASFDNAKDAAAFCKALKNLL